MSKGKETTNHAVCRENAPLLSSGSCLALIQSSDHMILFASVSPTEWSLLGMQLVIVQ